MLSKLSVLILVSHAASVMASVPYRVPALPADQCEVILWPGAQPVTSWKTFTRAVTKVAARDLFTPTGEVSLNDKTILDLSFTPASKSKEVMGSKYYVDETVTLAFDNDKARAVCLRELPRGTFLELRHYNGKTIAGWLGGAPGEPRYFVHRRADRIYRILLDWRGYYRISVPRDVPQPWELFQLALTRSNRGEDRKADRDTELDSPYQDLDDPFVRKAFLSAIPEVSSESKSNKYYLESLKRAVEIETKENKLLKGVLDAKDSHLFISQGELHPGYSPKIKVTIDWQYVRAMRVDVTYAFPKYAETELQMTGGVRSIEKYLPTRVQHHNADTVILPGVEIGSVVSLDIGLGRPLVGVLTGTSPLGVMVRDANGANIDVEIDPARVRGAKKGWAADNILLGEGEIFVKGRGYHYSNGYGKVLKLNDDGSFVLQNTNGQSFILDKSTPAENIILAPRTPEIMEFQKAFNVHDLQALYLPDSYRSPYNNHSDKTWVSAVRYLPGLPNSGIAFELDGTVNSEYLHEKSNLFSRETGDFHFDNVAISNNEAFEIIKSLPQYLLDNGFFRLRRRLDGNIQLVIWVGSRGNGTHSPNALQIAAALTSHWPVLGAPILSNLFPPL